MKTEQLKRIFKLCLLAAWAGLSASAAGRTGVAGIGFGAWSAKDRELTAEAFASAKREAELAVLYKEFRREDPMRPLVEFAKDVLPRLQGAGRLHLTVYLDSAPNRDDAYGAAFRPNLSSKEFWGLAGGASSDPKVQAFYRDWDRHLEDYRAAMAELAAWAKSRKLNSRLTLTACPVLEDEAGANTKAYSALLKATKQKLKGLPLKWRRNPLSASAPRVSGTSFELHGLQEAAGKLRRSDVLTNDGSPTSMKTWRALQRPLLKNNISCLYWTPEMNGGPRSTRPDQRGVLRPWTSQPDPAATLRELAELLKGN